MHSTWSTSQKTAPAYLITADVSLPSPTDPYAGWEVSMIRYVPRRPVGAVEGVRVKRAAQT